MAHSDEQRRLLGGMSIKQFLREHWQKKPLLVRGAFAGFQDPITPDELAGLSCEDGIESRIVREKGGAAPWEVTWGPHEEGVFYKLPARGWTLLVQEINRWIPEAALLLEHFAFLPSVRVDDVMVSFAAPGGSVGPHVDSYDVFLVQGQGKRRWRYGTRAAKDVQFRPGLELRILERFEADADEVLAPGDMLYLPPGFAHHGVAVTPCLTYSIGFRAPSAGEAWSSFASWAAVQSGATRLLVDPPLQPADNPGAIPRELLERVRSLVRSLDTSDDAIDRWYASFATRLKPGHALTPPRRVPALDAVLRKLEQGRTYARSEEARWAFLPSKEKRDALVLYVGGVELSVPAPAAPLARAFCSSRRFHGHALRALVNNRASRDLFMQLLAMGAIGEARSR